MATQKTKSPSSLEYSFLSLCKENNYSEKDICIFKKAIEFSKSVFEDRKRLSGTTWFEHSLKVGKILAESNLFSEVVAAGILYGTEKKASHEKMLKEFGQDITNLVYGQLNLKVIKQKSKSVEAEILRKILLTTLSDIRIIFVKLANKLENLKTLKYLYKEKQESISNEVMEIYAPLAGRLGLYNLKKDLEDNAFYFINPKKYNEIKKFLDEYQPERESFIEECTNKVSGLLDKKNIEYKIKGREKHIYSIYKKMSERGVPLHKQKDHFAIRMITTNIQDCYNILGIIYESYPPLEGTFKDYIANPKPNGYKSLHSIIKVNKKQVEVQIRTQEMDDFAEEGPAAHWSYKGIKSDFDFEKRVGFLKSVLDLQLTQKEEELLKNIKVDLFSEDIYCYTPKGKLITLPKDACVLDFAYHIHQEIGDKTVAGRVNGNFVSLKKILENGDIVEIITNKNQRPHRNWLNFVVSSKAKSVIRKSIKKYENIPAPSKIKLEKKDKDVCDSLVCSEDLDTNNTEFIFAKCCSCTPKDKIFGVIKSNKKILIHNQECENIDVSNQNIIPLSWKSEPEGIVKINIESKERTGVLADLLNIFASEGFIIKEAKIKLLPEKIVKCIFKIFPKPLTELVKTIDRVEKIKGFKRVYFGD